VFADDGTAQPGSRSAVRAIRPGATPPVRVRHSGVASWWENWGAGSPSATRQYPGSSVFVKRPDRRS
jgi:hypothetical protein